jgi:hypothetical protein
MLTYAHARNSPHLPVSARTRTSMRDGEWTRKSSKRGNTCNACESRHLAIHEAVVEGLDRVVQGMLGVFLGDHERSILPLYAHTSAYEQHMRIRQHTQHTSLAITKRSILPLPPLSASVFVLLS